MPHGGAARDNELVSEDKRGTLRAGLARALAFARSAEPRVPLSQRAVLTDIAIAAVVLAVSLSVAKFGRWPGPVVPDLRTGAVNIMPGQVVSISARVGHEVLAIVILSVPSAVRRRFQLTAFGVLLRG